MPVAIIGLGGMFAGSSNLKEYWRVLVNGIDCITDPPATHAGLNTYFDSDPKRPDHIYALKCILLCVPSSPLLIHTS